MRNLIALLMWRVLGVAAEVFRRYSPGPPAPEKTNAELIAQGCHPADCDPWCDGGHE